MALEIYSSYLSNAISEKKTPIIQQNVMPFEYERITQNDSYLLYALLLMTLGGFIVYLMNKFSLNDSSSSTY